MVGGQIAKVTGVHERTVAWTIGLSTSMALHRVIFLSGTKKKKSWFALFVRHSGASNARHLLIQLKIRGLILVSIQHMSLNFVKWVTIIAIIL